MPEAVRFNEIRRLLEQHGWAVDRIRGSHFIFTGANRPTLAIPVHGGKCKPAYERIVKKAIAALGQQRPSG